MEAIEQVLDHTALHVSDLQRIDLHYAHTLRLWRMWGFYLAKCEAGFRSGYLDDAVITLAR